MSAIPVLMYSVKRACKCLRAAGRLLPVLAVILALTAPLPLRAEEQDEEYLRIFNIILQADTLQSNGKTEAAKTKYAQAQTALQELRRTSPNYNPTMVNFRLSYVAEKLAPTAETNAPTTTAAGGAKGTSQAASSSVGETQLKLLAPGAEPRSELRLHPKAGDKQTVELSMKIGMDMKMGEGQSQAMNMPEMQMIFDLTVKELTPEGDIVYETVITDAKAGDDAGGNPQMAEQMRNSLGMIKGLTGTGRMSSRGISKGMEIKLPNNADAQVRQSVEQMRQSMAMMSSPLPEEPVGVGAKWEVKNRFKTQGMTIEQTSNCEVTEIEGDRVKTKLALTQTAANQKLQNPAMPSLVMNLSKMSGQGTGDTTIDLTRIAPVQSGVDMQTDMAVTVDVGGQKQPVSMKMNMDVKFESK